MSEAQLPSNETLRQLQEVFLKAAITKEPLPNNSRVINFPDLAYILRHPNIYVSHENLIEPISIANSPKPLRVLRPEDIEEEVRKQGDLAYLHFLAPRAEEDGVRLVLEGRIASSDPHQRPLGLSSVQLKFRDVNGRWEVDEPTMMAM